MNDLSDKMRERLEKWRQKAQSVASANKVRGNQTYVARKDYGDEYEEEMILQEQRNRSSNGTSVGGKTAK